MLQASSRKRKRLSLGRIFGGKGRLFSWILSEFPKDYEKLNYVEPFIGFGSVYLNKTPSEKTEIINDLDFGLYCIWHCLKFSPVEFARELSKLRYTEFEFNRCKMLLKLWDGQEKILDRAEAEFVARRMSRVGLKKDFSWSDRIRRGKPEMVSSWESAVSQIPAVADRLKNTAVFNKPAIEIIKDYDYSDVLIYIDPPYVHETRTTKNAYSHEMSDKDHEELAAVLNTCKAKIVLSGYESKLYDQLYPNWNRVYKIVANNSSQAKTKTRKVEVLFKNY